MASNCASCTLSDKTLQALSKHIQQELSPAMDEDEDEDSENDENDEEDEEGGELGSDEADAGDDSGA